MSAEEKASVPKYWENGFLMGTRELLTEVMGDKPTKEEAEAKAERYQDKWNEFLLQSQIYISKLLKAENLAFLLGAGPSIPIGGITIRNVPLQLEHGIHESLGSDSEEVALFYQILEYLLGKKPFEDKDIGDRAKALKDSVDKGAKKDKESGEIEIPLEDLLSFMYSLRSTLINPVTERRESEATGELALREGSREVKATGTVLEKLITAIKREYFNLLAPMHEQADGDVLKPHRRFIKKILTRPLNLRRPKIFTTNNDLVIEKAMDESSTMYLDGFLGTTRRFFRPESYNYDFYFPSTSTEGRVHRVDQVIHFYKIHGSINWIRSSDGSESIYGIEAKDTTAIAAKQEHERVMIYPTPLKHEFTLDFPYSDLFRRFADGITQPQSVLITLGYSFGDHHVNRIIYQALQVPSFTLLIVDPAARKQKEILRLIKQKDTRIQVISGWGIGTFERFTELLLPDIRELDVREKSAQTARRMLAREEAAEEGPPPEEVDKQ